MRGRLGWLASCDCRAYYGSCGVEKARQRRLQGCHRWKRSSRRWVDMDSCGSHRPALRQFLQSLFALSATALVVISAPAVAQRSIETQDATKRQQWTTLGASLRERQPDVRLRELRDCDATSGAVLSHFWRVKGHSAEDLNALIRASADVRDARTAAAARMAFEDEGRSMAERTAALTVLLNYLRPDFLGQVDQVGERIFVQAVAQSHPVWKEGSQRFGNAQRADIIKLFAALRSSSVPEFRAIAALAP